MFTPQVAAEPICFTPSEFTEFAVRLKGEPINLGTRPWIKAIYDLPVQIQEDDTYRRKMLLIFGRQCEKSTTLGNSFIAYANLIPYLRALYVTASNAQMREFSDERLRAVISDSPKLLELSGQVTGSLKKRLGTREVQNVQTKRWVSHSKITLRSVYQNADRCRGIPADLLGVDELQDIYVDNLPVIEETLFHSELEGGPISIYSGTPKTFDNPLEEYWSKYSTQNEWLTKCDRCNYWNTVEAENIGPSGLMCVKCWHPIDPVHGKSQWVRFGRKEAEWNGFRCPQPVVIYAYKHLKDIFERQWRDLLTKKKRYVKAKFQNEVMARSHDSGSKPVTYEEVRRCALPEYRFINENDITPELRATRKFGGVDWGTGDQSYTIASIWRYDVEGRFVCIWAKKYEGVDADPDTSVQDIIENFRKYNVQRIGADWGFGFHANPRLLKAFGADRAILYQHAGRQTAIVQWDKLAMRYTTHRTRVLQICFDMIKRGPVGGGVAFPNWDDFEYLANDILGVYQENSEKSGELMFNHAPTHPDDFLHTFCYALLASMHDYARPDLMAPGSGPR